MINLHALQDWLPRQLEQPQLRKWLKVAIIAAVFLVSLFEATRSAQRSTLILVGGIAAVAGGIILLRRPGLGLLLVVLAEMFIPATSLTGAGALFSPPILLLELTIGLWLADMLVRQRKIRFLRSPIVTAAFVFMVISVIAFLNGQIIYYAFAQTAPITAQIGGLMIFLLSMGALLAAAHLIDDVRWLERFTWLFVAIGGFYIIFGRAIPFTERYVRPRFVYGSTDGASPFWVWLAAIAFSQAWINTKLSKPIRLALLGMVIVLFYEGTRGAAYDWKSGWLPAAIAVLAILLIHHPRIRIPGIVVLAAGFGLSQFTRFNTLVTGNEDYSILTREAAQRLVLEIAKVNPVLGLGFSNYYWYARLFPILGYRVQFNSHNNYVDLIAETGLVGLLVFLWLAAVIGLVGWRLQKIAPEGFKKAYVVGVLGGLVGMLASGMLGDWILPFVYNVGLNGFRSAIVAWLFIGGLVALDAMQKPTPPEEAASPAESA